MHIFRHGGVIAGFSEAADGNLFLINIPEPEAQAAWKKATVNLDLGIEIPYPRFNHQVHGADLREVQKASPEGRQGLADALLTTEKGATVGVFTADCLPVLIAANGVVAAIHAGWKGSRENITGKALTSLRQKQGVKNEEIRVFMGPCIGQCCLELGEEIPPTFFLASPLAPGCFSQGKKWHLDLRALNVMQCLQEGIRPEQIQHVPDCTKCLTGRYFSYRGQKGRHGSMFSFILRT